MRRRKRRNLEMYLHILGLLDDKRIIRHAEILNAFPKREWSAVENTLKHLAKIKFIKKISTMDSYTIKEKGVEFLKLSMLEH
jgi:RIO-like serine/threonine protein kinase